MPPIENHFNKMAKVRDYKWITNNGRQHQKLEKELEDYLQVDIFL
ncbi:MAG: hypothetical protein ACOC1K_07410 [Nanoarchaeota archaeon]